MPIMNIIEKIQTALHSHSSRGDSDVFRLSEVSENFSWLKKSSFVIGGAKEVGML